MRFVRARLAGADREAGFTLVELLIVMLVLANLAAIAVPMFFNQKTKANDAKAKLITHHAKLAMETCNTSNGGAYSATNCTLAGLRAIDPSIPAAGVEVQPNVPAGGYTIKVTAAPTNNTFSVKREGSGAFVFKCTVASASNRGGCPGTGATEGSWG
jgi:prepilin-type N-terminal cleavage/methylation domain-containing protein